MKAINGSVYIFMYECVYEYASAVTPKASQIFA